MKIVVLGASGMIGGAMMRQLSTCDEWQVQGIVRTKESARRLGQKLSRSCYSGYDLSCPDHIVRLFRKHSPDVIINCAGYTKHVPEGNDPIPALTINSLLPHRLAEICGAMGVRLIHVSTDCVFSGTKGGYSEDDLPDARDIYGKTKHLGEVVSENALTLRTSTIGHESGTHYGLLEWFLAQKECMGFRRAVFSGLPTDEFAKVIREHVLTFPELTGLYHVGATPINKDELLRLIAVRYGLKTKISSSDDMVIDRSLNVDRFAEATGYIAPPWPQLIDSMYKNYLSERAGDV